ESPIKQNGVQGVQQPRRGAHTLRVQNAEIDQARTERDAAVRAMFGSNHRSYEGPVTIRIFRGVLAGEIAAVNNASSQSFLFRRNSRIQDGHADAAAVEAH